MRRRTPFDPPRSRRAPRAVALALTATKAAALGGLLSLVVVSGLGAVDGSAAPEAGATDPSAQIVEQAMTSQQCSLQGFDRTTIPASALIRTPRGAVKVVTFQHGWDVYQGHKPGDLIAVCLRARPDR